MSCFMVTALMFICTLMILYGLFSLSEEGDGFMDLIFSFTEDFDGDTESLFSKVSGKIRISDRQTTYLRLAENYFEPQTLMSVLRGILAVGEESKLVKQEVDSV